MQNKEKSIAYTLMKFSLPLIFSGILQQLYNWADAFIVGNVDGELALAAIGSTSTVINLYLMAITGFTLGLSILFAQKFGSGDTAVIPKIITAFTILLGAAFGLLAAAGIGLTPQILRLLHTTGDTISMAENYLQIVLIGMPFLTVYNVYAAALRGIGDSHAPFLSILLSSAVNVALDILFVMVLRLGVAGAAAATVISQSVMTVFLIVYSFRKYSLLRFCPDKHALDKKFLIPGMRLGCPPMIQSSVGAAGSLILQNFMNGFGTQTVAAITTAYRVDSIVLLPIINLGSGISTIVAQNYGAGKKTRTREVLAAGIAIMAAVSLLLTMVVIMAGGRLIAIFGAGPEAVRIGGGFFRWIASFYLVYGIATAMRGYLEGIGDVLYSSMSGILSLVSRIILSYCLEPFYGNMVIAFAEAYSWGILLVLYFIRISWVRRGGLRKLRQ